MVEEKKIQNISEYLKQLREKKGISLEDAVNTLKISYYYLKTFEDGNFDSLPKDTYTKIFLRVYTEYLGGNVKEVMAGFAALLPEGNEIKEGQEIEEKADRPFNLNLMLVWIVTILVVMVFVGLFCGRQREKPLEETSFEEKEFSLPDTKKAENTGMGFKPAITENTENAETDFKPAVVRDAENVEAVLKPAATGKLVLKAKALEDVNLEMIVDDKITIKEVMKKDESRIWTAKNKFLINTDNIGALDFTFNDERFGVLGALGESKAGISFPPVKKEE
ncbi:MAG: helix-turn-helix domain-containing protein [bacterium]